MADVFISYSRKDKVFVQRLDAALKQRDRETWVDWEGIPPTADFMREIYGAIEGTDTFIFVLSPDSIASKVCGQEIAHAVAQNKRMIPVVAREVIAEAVPEALAKLNWIYCRESDLFDQATDTLISALDTDLDWVRAHTRLITRAVEWESKGKNKSFVLRGDDLIAGEQWLTEAGSDKERQPTALQTEYIIASRTAETQRQRTIRTWVGVAAAVAIVLAVFALIQRSKAENNAVEARKQEGIAKENAVEATRQKEAALETLSQADFMQGTRLVNDLQGAQALAYLARAVRLTGHPPAATKLVSLLTGRVWPRPLSTQRLAKAEQAFFSPDGSRAVVVPPDRSAALWDTATSKAIVAFEFEGGIESAHFSPDSRVVLVIGDDTPDGKFDQEGAFKPHVRMWNAQSGEPIGAGVKPPSSGSVVFARSSRYVALHGVDELRVWDTRTGTSWRAPVGSTQWSHVQFSADETRLLAWSDSLQMWEPSSGRVIPSTIKGKLGGEEPGIRPVAFSPDGRRVAITSNQGNGEGYGGSEQVWDLTTGKAVTPLMEHNSWVERLEFNADGRWLLAVGRTEAQVWDAATGGSLGEIRHASKEDLTAAVFSPDGQRIVSSAADGSVCVWDAATGAALTETIECSDARTVAFTPDGRSIIVTNEAGNERTVWNVLEGIARPLSLPGKTLAHHGFLLLTQIQQNETPAGPMRLWDIRSAKLLLEVALAEEVSHAGFSADERCVFVATDKVVRVWDIASRKELPPLVHTAAVTSAALSRDGGKAFTVAGAVSVWETGSGERRELKALPPEDQSAMARFSPDGSFAATTASDGKVQLWNVGTGAPHGSPLTHPTGSCLVEFSPDGRRLLTYDDDEEARKVTFQFWDIPSGRAVGEPITLPGSTLSELEFSPDGRWLIAASNAITQIFDCAQGRPAGASMPSHGGASPSFSADGSLLATVNDSGVRLWNPASGKPVTDAIKAPRKGTFTSVAFGAGAKRVVAAGPAPPEGLGGVLLVFDPTTGRWDPLESTCRHASLSIL